MDGIETAVSLQQKNIPVIFLTANSDDATFNRAKHTRPAAFITKPFKQLDLQRAIELTISRLAETEPVAAVQEEEEEQLPLTGHPPWRNRRSPRQQGQQENTAVKRSAGNILYLVLLACL